MLGRLLQESMEFFEKSRGHLLPSLSSYVNRDVTPPPSASRLCPSAVDNGSTVYTVVYTTANHGRQRLV